MRALVQVFSSVFLGYAQLAALLRLCLREILVADSSVFLRTVLA